MARILRCYTCDEPFVTKLGATRCNICVSPTPGESPRARRRMPAKPFPTEWAASHDESVSGAVNRQSRLSAWCETALWIVGGIGARVLRIWKGKR
jgi:hypothetical protein